MDRDSLPQVISEMVTEVIEIDYKHNPVTRRFWCEEQMRSVLRLQSFLGPVDADERDRIAAMPNDELELYEAEVAEKVETRMQPDPSLLAPK